MTIQDQKFKDWLEERISFQPRFNDGASEAPRYERISELAVANGGFRVTRWGSTAIGGDPWGSGLTQDEAVELMQYTAFMGGVALVGIPVYTIFGPYFERYAEKIGAGRFGLRGETEAH